MRLVFSPTSAARRALRLRFLPLLLLIAALAAPGPFFTGPAIALAADDASPAHHKAHKPKPAHTAKKTRAAHKPRRTVRAEKKSGRRRHRASRALRRARTARIKQAFVASAELRPMAQQLATLRTPAAYAGVTRYAQHHTGDAAAAAYLALGHAYLLDQRYAEAVASFRRSRQASDELADYADFLAARADEAAGDNAAAEALLHGFAQRYPDSIFVDQAPELEATALLALKNPAAARSVLLAAEQTDAAGRPGFQLVEAQVAAALGETAAAESLYKKLLLDHPLSPEAASALNSLTAMGAASSLTTAQLRILGDAYYNAGRYEEAREQFRALEREPELSTQDRAGFAVAAAACDLKLDRLTTAQAEALADTPDENGARRDYLLMVLARDRGDLDRQNKIVAEMESRFPASPWLADALFDTGNTYLLLHQYPQAIADYSELAARFPRDRHAAAVHWRAAWLTYRLGDYANAARLFDEQIRLYPTADETVAALYWRGRLDEAHRPAEAAAAYRAIVRAYPHYFYAQMARQRLVALGDLKAPPQSPVPAEFSRFQSPPPPVLSESFPADSPHLAKARLLANAGLNEYIAQEIAADPDSDSWSALAEAQIYASYGETFRALRAVKRAFPSAAETPIRSIPLAYWRILFPEPYWQTIQAESAKNGLDPYLVASLIRQESEFNPSAVSHADAWGLMQLLPSVGRSMARQEGLHHFRTYQLLDPETNIRLGTRYLHQQLDQFGGAPEYALAAYNAGDSRVAEWRTEGPYSGMDEFVESIPFHETRGYVESILRNIEIYKEIDAAAAPRKNSARTDP